MQKPTVYDVAQRANVSIATVSYTFHHPEKVRDKTRQRILQAASDLGYVRNASAVSLANKNQNALGLFAFDMLIDHKSSKHDPTVLGVDQSSFSFPLYVDEVQRGFQLECWHRHQALIVDGGDSKKSDAVANIAGRVDGLAIFPSPASMKMDITHLSEQRPIVYFSEGRRNENACFINCDNRSGMTMLVAHLIDKHHIHSVMFVGDLGSYDVQTRYAALQDLARSHGLSVGIIYGVGNDPDYHELKKLVKENLLPDSFICATDQVAILTMSYLQELNVRIPEDVIVTGFDGILAGQLAHPTLTSVQQPMEEMGRQAVSVLIEQNGEPFRHKKIITLQVQLLVGESCGCQINQ